MKWYAFVAGKKKQGTHVIEVPNTSSMADSRVACIFASKQLGVPVDKILCIPKKD